MDEIPDTKGIKLERDYVRTTYDKIADDFSSTRYKKWPRVEVYLRDLPTASLLLDVGCGNGKYLDNPGSYNIGCDLSLNLLKICKSRGFEVVLCDMSALPFKREVFDSVICVAVLHHVISARRRQKCLKGISDLLAPSSGSLLIQVWSFEQDLGSDNPYLKRTPHAVSSQDEERVEIDANLDLPIHTNRTPFKNQDVLVPFHTKSKPSNSGGSQEATGPRELRYYHVFRENELDSMLRAIPDLSISQSFYDKGNWCAIARKSELARGEPADKR